MDEMGKNGDEYLVESRENDFESFAGAKNIARFMEENSRVNNLSLTDEISILADKLLIPIGDLKMN